MFIDTCNPSIPIYKGFYLFISLLRKIMKLRAIEPLSSMYTHLACLTTLAHLLSE
jgi:hypothetical protein